MGDQVQKLQQKADKATTKEERVRLLRKIAELKNKESCIVKN